MEAEADGGHEGVADLGRGGAAAHGRQEEVEPPAHLHELRGPLRPLRSQSQISQSLRI